MNLIIIKPDEIDKDLVVISDARRATHIIEHLKPVENSILKTGVINGKIGNSTVLHIKKMSRKPDSVSEIVLKLGEMNENPPQPLPVTLVLAMQRPKTLKKILQNATAMGVKSFYIIESWKVEKSYWTSSLLRKEEIEKQFILGLEQAGDTILPQINIRRRFKPFLEDEIPNLVIDKRALVAHPYAGTPCHNNQPSPIVLAIGPEGGFTDYEVNKFIAAGFSAVTIGARILRTEFAVTAILAKLF